MYRIRYYDQVIHPDHFQGKGALGWSIRVLNAIRWWIETLVQRLVLRHLAQDAALPKQRMAELRRVFDLDVAAERLERQQTSPLLERLETPKIPNVSRSERYADGRHKTALDVSVAVENDMPVRPTRLDRLIQSYGAPGREKHYGRGRRFTLADEDAFEALDEPETDHG